MTRAKESSAGGRGVLPGEERRRSQRVMIRVPVVLHFVLAGQTVTVRAETLVVNDHGAMLLCQRSFDSGLKFEILNDRTRQRTRGRVTRPPRETPEGYLVPIEFEALLPNFWGITFPPSNWKPVES